MGFPLDLAYPLGGPAPAAYALSLADARGGSDGELRRIGDYCGQGLNLLIQEYKGRPRVEALLCSYVDRAQEIENAAALVYLHALSLDTGTGVALDLLGRIVGEARDGRPDEVYRRALRVRVLVNRSNSTIPELIAIAVLFDDVAAEAGAYARIRRAGTARLEARIVRTPVNLPGETDKRLRQARAAGVALSTLAHPGGPFGSFRFIDAADYPEKSTTEGFSHNDVGGGTLAHVLG